MRTLFCLLMIMAMFASRPVSAVTLNSVEGSPAAWRLQQYTGDNLILGRTGSTCKSPGLLTTTNLSSVEKSRLFSLIVTAKISNSKVYVFYDSVTCAIASFGMDSPE